MARCDMMGWGELTLKNIISRRSAPCCLSHLSFRRVLVCFIESCWKERQTSRGKVEETRNVLFIYVLIYIYFLFHELTAASDDSCVGAERRSVYLLSICIIVWNMNGRFKETQRRLHYVWMCVEWLLFVYYYWQRSGMANSAIFGLVVINHPK